MAFIGNIDNELKIRIKSELDIDDSDFNVILKIFTDIYLLIEKNYLSHLKNAIEDAVNEKRKGRIIKQVQENSNLTDAGKASFKEMLYSKQFRSFTILLLPLEMEQKAFVRIRGGSALIYYSNKITDEKDLRIYLAHEFGHIIISEFYPNRKMNTQNNATLFAFFAILDKDIFYKTKAKELTHTSNSQLLQNVVSLIKNKFK